MGIADVDFMSYCFLADTNSIISWFTTEQYGAVARIFGGGTGVFNEHPPCSFALKSRENGYRPHAQHVMTFAVVAYDMRLH